MVFVFHDVHVKYYFHSEYQALTFCRMTGMALSIFQLAMQFGFNSADEHFRLCYVHQIVNIMEP